MKSIDELAILHRTDKASHSHNFTEFYEDLLGHRRSEAGLCIMELGVKFGSSLRMWEDAFPTAKVVGVDNNWRIRESVRPRRSVLETCDLSDRSSLLKIAQRHGPFDLVVDDSAHTSTVTRNIIETLWPDWIKPGGVLVIEDINSGFKTDRATGQPTEAHDQIDYCASLVKNVCHSGKLGRCGPTWFELSSKFDIAIKEIIYRPGIMGMVRR